MADQAQIREIVERNIEVLALKPSRGHLTRTTKARLLDGVRCEIEEGPWTFAADLPPRPVARTRRRPRVCSAAAPWRAVSRSGSRSGPRAWAWRSKRSRSRFEADFDARGELGMGVGVNPGYAQVRYQVSIESQADRQDVNACSAWPSVTAPISTCSAGPWICSRVLRLNGVEA